MPLPLKDIAIEIDYWLARQSSAIKAAQEATTLGSCRRHLDLAMRLGLKADSFAALRKVPAATKRLLEPIRRSLPFLAPCKPRPLVLVVEDDELTLDLLEHHLHLAGYDVTRAMDGAAAMARLEEKLPAVVILAIMLPGMCGTEVLKRIRETPASRELPVMMLSHRDSEEDIVNALRDGASEYLTKPFMVGEVLERVSKLITPYEHPLKSLLDDLHTAKEPSALQTRVGVNGRGRIGPATLLSHQMC